MEDKKNDNFSINQEEFHIGLTMAGAISAGCYTAGAMDYLFEILDLWENAKNDILPEGWDDKILKYIPQHKVIIDVMGGASAGGMATVMSAMYALKGSINPVNNPSNMTDVKDNILYDSWVLMGDDINKKEKIFEETLSVDDLKGNKLISLLNSQFIDNICDNAFSGNHANQQTKPNYISGELEIILSQTMLRSVALPIDFSTKFGRLRKKPNSPQYNTFEHFVLSHFKLDYDNNNPLHKDFYLPFEPFSNNENTDTLKLATKATGAFPIGLEFRKFFNQEFSVKYMENNSKKLIFNTLNPNKIPSTPVIEFNVADPFSFIGIDGGAINNEPIGEVLSILKDRYGEKKNPEDVDKFALIMIDPFPNHQVDNSSEHPEDVFSVISPIIGTLQDQSRIKRKEMLEFYTKDYFRGEIFPVRYNDKNQPEEHHIACSSAFAFGGFLDIKFRHHDFFLGRDNARNFFKVYFSFEYDPENNNIHPIHKNWTPEMVNAFKFIRDKKIFLPIIPNLYELKDKLEGTKRNPFERTVKEWPTYNQKDLLDLVPKMEARVKRMVDITLEKYSKEIKDVKHPLTEKIINSYYREGLFKRVKGWVFGKIFNLIVSSNKGVVAKKATKATVAWILKDLEDKKLIK